MQKLLFASVLIILSNQLMAQSTAQQLPKSMAPFSYSLDDTTDKSLSFLATVLKNKKVVLLGESSHGIGDYYSMKARLIPYLHKELGFEVLAIESGIADVFLEYQQLDTLSGEQLRNRTVYGNFQCREILPLFNYIKASHSKKHPLLYCGFDSQNFSGSLRLTQKMLKYLIPGSADSLFRCMNSYYRIPALLWDDDKKPLIALGDTIRKATTQAYQLLESNAPALQEKFKTNSLAFSYLLRGLKNLEASVALDWTREDPVSKRDSIMAANLFWLMDSMYPGKKFIIWGHNGHIDKSGVEGSVFKWMGHFVKERYGDKAYHIGLFAKEGSTYEWWTKSNKTFNNNQSDDLEQILSPATGRARFFDISRARKLKENAWLLQKYYAFELENSGRVRFSPAERFDGLIVFRTVSLPDYK